jgi:hypothetical protein
LDDTTRILGFFFRLILRGGIFAPAFTFHNRYISQSGAGICLHVCKHSAEDGDIWEDSGARRGRRRVQGLYDDRSWNMVGVYQDEKTNTEAGGQ